MTPRDPKSFFPSPQTIFPPGEPPAAQPACPDCGHSASLHDQLYRDGSFCGIPQCLCRRSFIAPATAATEVLAPGSGLKAALRAAIGNYCHHADDGTDTCDCDRIYADVLKVWSYRIEAVVGLHPPASAVQPTTLLLDALKRQKAMAENVIGFGGRTELDDRYFRGKADGIQQVIDSIVYEQQRQPPASAVSPTYPIPLNEEQERVIKSWAADDRLWTTQETVEFNLRTFARKILSESSVVSPRETVATTVKEPYE